MYCQQVSGWLDFSIEAWNKMNTQLDAMGVSEAGKRKIMLEKRLATSGLPCKEQCFECLAIVGERRKKTANL
jgi:hypothetical protein